MRAVAITMACAACAAAPHPAARGEDVAAVLRTQIQAMIDAATVGDRAVWERYLAPDVLYLSEAGELEDRAKLLAELVPLPAGITEKVEISKFDARVTGDLAIVFHADEESENYFGHPIHAQYLNTETWRRGADGWKLVSAHLYASLLDPPAIQLPAAQLDDYVGRYELTDQIHYEIRRDGDHLVGQRDGRPAQPLAVEARDVLFIAGQPRSRKIFGRDAAGQVVRFADRREARDVVWQRR